MLQPSNAAISHPDHVLLCPFGLQQEINGAPDSKYPKSKEQYKVETCISIHGYDQRFELLAVCFDKDLVDCRMYLEGQQQVADKHQRQQPNEHLAKPPTFFIEQMNSSTETEKNGRENDQG